MSGPATTKRGMEPYGAPALADYPTINPCRMVRAQARADLQPSETPMPATPKPDREEVLYYLRAALARQTSPCSHDGIGLPGCVICDAKVREVANG